jgi:hypothetical protein
MKNTTLQIILLVVLAIILTIVTPFISIWALNTLFPVLRIPYTFWTWLAMLALNSAAFYKSSK